MRDVQTLQRALLTWFAKHRRDLPWRRTQDPYRILVSEIMLQQTQVDRVLPKYHAFLKCFPNVRALARAKQASVVTAWAGLGYNRRARNLHQAAQIVIREHVGAFPQTPATLRTLPGIGPYTAAAVACFAFGAPVALVDVNVRRVLGRYFRGVRGPQTLAEKPLWLLAAMCVPPKKSVAWNSALMDFGALVCTARSPKCEQCPLQVTCRAYPAITKHQSNPRKAKQPFAGSTRYWRGQVVTLLRDQEKQRASTRMLRRVFSERGLERITLDDILQQLAKDKLIRTVGGVVRL